MICWLCSYAAIRITTGWVRFCNQKWSYANSHQVGSKPFWSFFYLHQVWNFFLLFSFGQEGDVQKFCMMWRDMKKFWPFKKYPVPPPPARGIHNECSLTSTFFSLNLGDLFFICFIVFWGLWKTASSSIHLVTQGNVLQKRASAETVWVREKCYYMENKYTMKTTLSPNWFTLRKVFSPSHINIFTSELTLHISSVLL